MSKMRLMHKHPGTVSVRFHTDMDMSFRGEVEKYCLNAPWCQTMTEGYDSNSNSIVEGRNKKLESTLRAILISATGGRQSYEELWDVGMDHAHDIVNHSPEAGTQSPAQKAGADTIDINHMVEVFGAEAWYYENKGPRTEVEKGGHKPLGVVKGGWGHGGGG